VTTVDYFTPVVDDPRDFGRIAAVNSLSDIYAMGGTPISALNIVGFPEKILPLEVLAEILRGGAEISSKYKIPIVGGHTVKNDEPFYGLSVTGKVNLKEMMTNASCKPGDYLYLTKPLGSGVITTALKQGKASEEIVAKAVEVMVQLNKDASEAAIEAGVKAATDVTGFGFLGHLAEMVTDSGFGVKIQADRLPIISKALEFAGMGLVPAGAYRNRDFRSSMVDISSSVNLSVQDVLFDPQTSGGLLICVENKIADRLLDELKNKGMDKAAIVGTVLDEPKGRIVVC